MAVHLHGVAVTGFRSLFGAPLQRVAPMQKVHLIAGPNNSGKSNVLRAVGCALPALQQQRAWDLEPGDQPQAEGSWPLRVAIGVSVDKAAFAESLGDVRDAVKSLLDEAAFRDDDTDLLWFEFEHLLDSRGATAGWRTAETQVASLQNRVLRGGPNSMSDLSSALTRTGGGAAGDDERRVIEFLAQRLEVTAGLPAVTKLNPLRQITTDPEDDADFGRSCCSRG